MVKPEVDLLAWKRCGLGCQWYPVGDKVGRWNAIPDWNQMRSPWGLQEETLQGWAAREVLSQQSIQ